MKKLRLAYGDYSPSRSTLYFWIKEIKNGRVSVEDGQSTGRPQQYVISMKKIF